MTDAEGKANFTHSASTKTKRIVRSVLRAEKLAISTAADMSISMKQYIEEMTGENIELHMLTDSETLFSVLIKATTTSEIRLLIETATARQSFECS